MLHGHSTNPLVVRVFKQLLPLLIALQLILLLNQESNMVAAAVVSHDDAIEARRTSREDRKIKLVSKPLVHLVLRPMPKLPLEMTRLLLSAMMITCKTS